MAGVELVPAGAELVGGAALMRLARVLRALAPDHIGLPGLRPERIELHRLFVDADRVLGVALQRPGLALRVEVGEEAIGRILARRAGRQAAAAGCGGRAGDDVANLLAGEQG